ncbi:hypothetical protein acsn021_13040 [Anaerocolumna cellulosilytica]|uniref:Uncharacterized protein n=1 Tax=Anaerocolumna cellulosilytica TaxID=433286 RepID=A0A6S6R2I8_9FIRM|nr:BtrH N-terminal domain-containing protein [Anaerocolumna cellulosilytica]MBB5195967.1 hypothetical protein [Anaerocolumna cellulosilytica]BCJ93735.1 hypothetical protein acsn021_13040 [Anaerocolumna cellulosilytica]
MEKIIVDFRAEEAGKNCLYSAIRNVLNYEGLKITEAEVFFAFGGLDLRYHPEQCYYGISDIIGNIKKYIVPWISVESGSAANYKETVLDLSKQLDQKKPVVCIIQVGKLSYLDAPEEIKSPRRHTCVLYGLNEEKDKAYIADTYRVDRLGNITVFMGEISLRELMAALQGYFTLSCLLNTDSLPIQGIFREALTDFLHPLTKKNCITGYSAFLEYLNQLKNYDADKKLYQQKCFEAGYLIKVTTIQPYLDYFTEILPILSGCEKSHLYQLVKELEEIKTMWDDFRVKLIRDSFRDKEKRDKSLFSFSETIMKRQKEIFQDISTACSGS